MPLSLEVLDDSGSLTLDDRGAICELADFAARQVGLVGDTLALALVTLPEMRDLHLEYFDDDSPTDVITFPANEPWVDEAGQHLGDIVICIDVAEEQAREASHIYCTEVAFLMLHGMLHIAGYDDADEASRHEMIQLQGKLLQAFDARKRGN